MADPVYGPGGTGYYTDPATGKRYWQTRYEYGPDAYDPKYDSRLVYDPATNAADGSGSPNAGTVTPGTVTPGTGTPSPPTSTTTTGATSALSADQQSAKAVITSLLATYGLDALATRAWNMYLTGEPIEQIMLELRQTPEYKARFPGMDALSQKGRAISEADYINVEKEYVALFRQAGLPVGFYDSPDDFGRYIANEVSPQEMGDRLNFYTRVAYQTPPEVRAELSRLYGAGIGDVTALLLDETKALPLIQNQYLSAQNSATAIRAGFGALTAREGEALAQLGLSDQQVQQGFSTLAQSQQLFNPLLTDTGENTIGREDQLGAVFGGNAAAMKRIQDRAARRRAVFDEGGGYFTGQGFGTAEGA